MTFIALLKHILKMAQFALFSLRWGMFAESFSMVVGVAAWVNVVVGVTDMVGVETGKSLGDEGRDVVNSGTKELAGLCMVVEGWAGPITCSKL
jgi:hypothetical protein